jgi:hypothetical protein
MRAGMDKKAALILECERQLRQEGALRGIEAGSGPRDCLGGDRIHSAGAARYGGVVIAKQRDRASLDLAHDRIDGKAGIGTVANVIAEKNEAPDTGTTRVIKARLKRLAIGVDIAE